MKIKEDLKKYLDNNISNYLILITDDNKILYNNAKLEETNTPDELKRKITIMKNDNKLIDFFNDTSIEYYNFIMSSNNILYNSAKIKNIAESTIKNYSDICQKVVSSGNADIDITKFFKKVSNCGSECILPIISNKKNIASLVVITGETIENDNIKESFFRYSLGLLLTITYFINEK